MTFKGIDNKKNFQECAGLSILWSVLAMIAYTQYYGILGFIVSLGIFLYILNLIKIAKENL